MFILTYAIIPFALYIHCTYSKEITSNQLLVTANKKPIFRKATTDKSHDRQSDAPKEHNQFIHTPSSERVNINTADITRLKTLPYIGTKRAEAIIAYRTQQPHQCFQSPEELLKIKGMSTKLLARIQAHITVEGL